MNDQKQAALTFPCTFPMKVIGRNEADFKSLVLGIMKKHVPDLDLRAVSARTSSGEKYLSISTMFTAKSRKQVDDLYIELTGNKKVLWVL
jgi:putative lipoic acid-binding regulatory protein